MSEYAVGDPRYALRQAEAERLARIRQAVDQAAMAEVDRLRQMAASRDPLEAAAIDTPEATVYGHGPGYGPEVTARQLERAYGPLEDVPGWFNARQFGEAAAGYAREIGAGDDLRGGDGGRSSQWLMTPERFSYMQAGPGRAVDLLADLRQDPERAQGFWERSKGARTTRSDYSAPNYGRYGGFAPAAQELLSSPLSPLGGYLQMQNVVPAALKHWTGKETDAPGGALGTAYAGYLARQRYRTGEVPILDIEEQVPGESLDDRDRRWLARHKQVLDDIEALEPPSAEELARNVGGRNAPAVLGTAIDMLTGLADATLPVSIAGSMAKAPAQWMMRESAQAAARSSGIPARAASRMVERAARVHPAESPLSHGARVAGYRGVPASAYAAELRRPTLANVIPRAASGSATEEIVPEVAVEGAISAAMPQPERGWGEYLAKPAVAGMTDDEYAAHQMQRRDAAELAAARTEALEHTNPNSIHSEFFRPHFEAERRRFENRDRSGGYSAQGWAVLPGAQ